MDSNASENNHKEGEDSVMVTSDKISLEELVAKVGAPSAGAISTFSGTTRDNFNGKKVLHLYYEAYIPMALKEMQEICHQMRSKWQLIKIALVHRIGEVPIGEASVIIAISSAHRRDSLEATQYAIDEIKAKVPIWKKEFYEDGSMWKENCEACHHHKLHHHDHN